MIFLPSPRWVYPERWDHQEQDKPMNTDENPKDAIGSRKPPTSTLPWPAIFEAGVGMFEGACKYRRHNYRASRIRASVYFDAALRHLAAWYEGEDIDPDSGLHHVSKAIASMLVLRDAQMNDMILDDRPPKSKSNWLQILQEHMLEVVKRYPNPLKPYTEDQGLDVNL